MNPRPFRILLLLPALALTLGAAGGCGNYSNDDLDFQLAVPKREELVAKLPGRSPVGPDAAEYYRATRDGAAGFNRVVMDLCALVDEVRALPPSGRDGGERLWGPFRHRTDRDWEIRLRMWRAPDAPEPTFQYAFEIHRAGAPASPWHPLLSGAFGPGRSHGELVLDLAAARKNGYPVQEFDQLLRLTLRYQRRQAPFTVDIEAVNVPESPKPEASYHYEENPDRSGSLSFVWRQRDNLFVQAAEIRSRWNAAGAGRADARVIEGVAAMGNAFGIDCWGPDGRATYVLREYGARREEGAAAACAFPDL
jgi:hypothetical protein